MRKARRTYVVDEAETGRTRKEESAREVAPQAGDEGRDHKAEYDDEPHIPPVLPLDDGAPAQVADVGDTGLAAGLDEHPADVREEEALVRVVGIKVRVGVAVMRAVATRPPLDGALDGTGACSGQEVLQGLRRVVGAMCPETVVARRYACMRLSPTGELPVGPCTRVRRVPEYRQVRTDEERLTEACEEVVQRTPEEGLPAEMHVRYAPDGDGRGADKDGEGEPLDVLDEVAPCDWRQSLLVAESPGDVVVGNVEVGGLFLFERDLRLRQRI